MALTTVDAPGDGFFQGRASSFMEYECRNRLGQEIAAAGFWTRARPRDERCVVCVQLLAQQV